MDFDLWKYYEKNKNWLVYVFLIYAVLNIVGLFFNLYRTQAINARSAKTDEILQQNSEILKIINESLVNSTYSQNCNATK